LQDGRAAIAVIKYIGKEGIIFDGNDLLLEGKISLKIDLVNIL